MVTLPIDLDLILERGHIRILEGCELIYDSNDPFAVVLITRDDLRNEETEWVFGRDLLTDGLARQLEPRPGGDVRVWRCDPYQVHITLVSPEGTAELHAEAEDIDQFLRLAYAAVPLTHELDHVDIGHELAVILGEAA